MLVLLWGLESDSPLAAVRRHLALLNVPTAFIDQRRVLETQVEINVGETIEGVVRLANESIDLAEVSAVYLRPYESVRLAQIAGAGPESAEWSHAARVDDILLAWSQVTPAFVVNRCSAMAANGSKPYQLEQIRRLGWSVPDTLVTTDADEARAFWNRYGEVIYKSVSSVRSRVARLRIEHTERFRDLATCPTQLQQFIAGDDYRVHVVGEQVFASKIKSSADDYRFADQEVPEIRPCILPREFEDKCRTLAAALELPFAGIDLRRNDQGEWFCFEVNPSPAFTYYQEATGQPIGEAVAELLTSAARPWTETVSNGPLSMAEA
jgi:glutathione synthase/RimK-type ligase-like ATP-grasp enzyme